MRRVLWPPALGHAIPLFSFCTEKRAQTEDNRSIADLLERLIEIGSERMVEALTTMLNFAVCLKAPQTTP